jgi:hypothetical protein
MAIVGKDTLSDNKIQNYAKVGLFGAVMLWGIIQLTRIDKKNEDGITNFKQAHSQLQKNSNNLFISIGGAFPLQKFPAWSPPSRFPIYNLITGEHYLHNLHQNLIARFPKESIRYLGDSLILKGQ